MPETPPGIADLSDEALKLRTGKGLADWQRILRRFGIRKHGHAAAARHLRERYRLDTATANQIVILHTFTEAGKRGGPKREGYRVRVSARVAASRKRTWSALTDTTALRAWLGRNARVSPAIGGRLVTGDGARGTFTRLREPLELALDWEAPALSPGSRVTIRLTAHGTRACTVTITHAPLRAEIEADKQREGWRWALAALGAHLKGEPPPTYAAWLATQRRPAQRASKKRAPSKVKKKKKKKKAATRAPVEHAAKKHAKKKQTKSKKQTRAEPKKRAAR